jgi:endo-1,4-beta-xylanase
MYRAIISATLLVALFGLSCSSKDGEGGGGLGGKAGSGGNSLSTQSEGGKGAGGKISGVGGAGADTSTYVTGGTQSGGTRAGGTTGSGGATPNDAAISKDGTGSGGAAMDARGDSPEGTGGAVGMGGNTGKGSGGNVGKDAGTTSTGGKKNTGGTSGTGGTPNLWEKYADYFPIGAAVDTKNYNSSLLTKHFNSVTAEDQMKFDALEPSENSFSYGAADQIVDYARTHNMKVRGHTLVWHRQNPSWVFANATKDTLLKKMKNHISNVMKHFSGKVYAWDVVNEAIMETGEYRTGNESKDEEKSQWYAIIGKSYVAEAFQYAHEADPSAKLFYNDYYDYLPKKSDAIYAMLKELLDSGVVIHGVGMQCHLNIEPSTDNTNQAYYQTVANLEEAIKKYSSLGLEVQVTEMDLSLYVPGVTYTSATYYTAATFTSELQTKQADRYREFFELFRNYKDVITGVTLWGITDDNTWLSEFSSGRKDFPLLFDANQQPKKAYYALVDF